MRKLTLATACMALSAVAFAEPKAAPSYNFVGDSLARQVCKSITEDNASQLHKLLKKGDLSVYVPTPRAKVRFLNSFSCNQSTPLEFAQQVNASNVADYINRLQGRNIQLSSR